MTTQELLASLEANRGLSLRFVLPSGELIPDHFHITEVGKVEKTFIDCGGTRRKAVSCLLQAWTAHDVDHRLSAGKMAKILHLAEPVLGSFDLPVELEYGAEVASQYILSMARIVLNELHLDLVGKQTDCLARDKCGIGECGTSDCCR